LLGIFVLFISGAIFFYTKKSNERKDKKEIQKGKDLTLDKEIKKPEEKSIEEKKEKKRHVKESILKMLDENEKKIISMLEDSDMEITQAYIHKTLDIPKASLSKIINRLEHRNLIEKKKEGRTNWIKLKDWVFK